MERIDEIRARYEKATPGPWFSHESHNWHKDPPKEYFVITRGMRSIVASWAETADADFIAHAREDVPWLLVELETWKATNEYISRENDGLRAALEAQTVEHQAALARIEAMERALRATTDKCYVCNNRGCGRDFVGGIWDCKWFTFDPALFAEKIGDEG